MLTPTSGTIGAVAELADAGDLKSPGGNTLWVRPPPALLDILGYTAREPHWRLLFGRLFDFRAVCVRNVIIVHEQCISVPQIMEANDKLCYTPAVGTDITNNN